MAELLDFGDLRVGMRATVEQVDKDAAFCDRLLEIGLTPGVEFKVIKVAPFGDPVEIDIRGFRLCLRKSECCCLRVKRVE